MEALLENKARMPLETPKRAERDNWLGLQLNAGRILIYIARGEEGYAAPPAVQG